MTEPELLLRLSIAVAAGLLRGVDRQLGGVSAGLRTHAVVGLNSAVAARNSGRTP